MTREPYTAIGSDITIGPPHFGLSPERIKVLDQQARVRIAAENAEKEARKAEKAARKAAVKEQKVAAKGKLRDEGNESKNDMTQGLIVEEKHEKKGVLGSLKNLLKKNKEEDIYVR